MARLYTSPWAAQPWGGFDQLRREMDALLSRFGDPAAGPGPSRDWRGVYPPVNLYESADCFMLTAELPGVDPDGIHVSLEGSTVTLEGERRVDYSAREGASLHRRERPEGHFRRSFELPAVIDADKVEAAHRNGVLMLRLPKSPEAQPRQIQVRGS